MINRKNYEVWFLDFAEGTLSDYEINALYEFIDSNPDLKEEFEEFSIVTLENESIIFDAKNSLLQPIKVEEVDGLNSFEVLAIKKIEGDISTEEERELNSLLRFSPKLNTEFRLLEKTKLKVDKTIIYKSKDKLKKRTVGVIPIWARYIGSIAAIGLLILFVQKILSTNIDGKINNTNIVVGEKIKPNIPVVKNLEGIKNNQEQIKENNSNLESVIPENKTYSNNQIKLVNSTTKKSNIHTNTVQNFIESNKVVSTKNIEDNVGIPNYIPDNIVIAKSKINRKFNTKLEFPRVQRVNLPLEINRQALANITNKQKINVAITPKQYLIKTVKNKLDIDDNNYDNINTMDLVSSTLKKARIAKVDFKKDEKSKRKHLALNFGIFKIERSWASN